MYNEKTSNLSFLEMSKFLKMSGVKNNMFMLEQKSEGAILPNPYDPDLSDLQKGTIRKECKENIWYFLREVVRVRSEMGGYSHFQLNAANLATIFLLTKGVNIYSNMCRQSYSSTTIVAYLLCNRNISAHIDGRNIDLCKARLLDAYKTLPSYIKEDGIPGLSINQTDKDFYWYDDIEYFTEGEFNSFKLEEVKKNVNTHIIISNSGVSDIVIPVLCNIKSECKPFFITMYDVKEGQTLPKWVKLEFNADDIGRTEMWKKDIFRQLGRNQESYDREIMLIRKPKCNSIVLPPMHEGNNQNEK